MTVSSHNICSRSFTFLFVFFFISQLLIPHQHTQYTMPQCDHGILEDLYKLQYDCHSTTRVFLHLNIMSSSTSPPQPFTLSSRQINVRLGIFRISFDVFPVDKSSNDFSHLEAMEVDRVIYHLINNNKLCELN